MKHGFFNRFLRGLSQAFFPEGIKCNCCGDELPRAAKYSFCEKCLEKLTFTGKDICKKCGSLMENAADFCQTCKFNERTFDSARGVLLYSGEAARLIKAYKSGDKYLAPYFADMMRDYYIENLAENKPDAVCFVPCGKKRLKERGYNQSQVLAKLLCERLELPLYACLEQTGTPGKQSLLKAADRVENVKNAYAVNLDGLSRGRSSCRRQQASCCRPAGTSCQHSVPGDQPADTYDITDKRIMLIDDIFTTGSTAGECARALKEAGAKEVVVFTLATGKGL